MYDKDVKDALNATLRDLSHELGSVPQHVLEAAVLHYAEVVAWCRIYLADNRGQIPDDRPVLIVDVCPILLVLREMQEAPTVKVEYPRAAADTDKKETVH